MSATSNSAQSLQSRLEAVRSSLEAQQSKLEASRRNALIVGAVALLLAGGYFLYGYKEFASVLKAQSLVSLAQDLVNRNLPTARRALADQINQSADVWAAGLSQQALGAVPEASEKLGNYVVAQVDDALSQAVLLEDAQFRSFVREKHDVLQDGFDQLARGPEMGEETLQTIDTALEEQLQSNLDEQATDLFGSLLNLNAKLQHLREGHDLTPDEVVERRVLMLAGGIKLNQQRITEAAQNDASGACAKPAGSNCSQP